MCSKNRTAEQILASTGGERHGVVTRVELIAAGLTPRQIHHRVQRGDLIPRFRGVYSVGHAAPSLDADYLAAVRACGEHAVLFRRPAAYLFGLIRGSAPAPEVLTMTDRRVGGVVTQRTRLLDRRDITTLRGIPITTVPRTLVDLTPVLSEDELARACHEAWIRYRVTPARVEAVLTRRPNSPGATTLRLVIGGDVHVTLSKLEKRFLKLLREAGLPLPITNKLVDAHLVDCRWPDHALTVELDSYRFHNTRYSWQQGYGRERAAYARDDEFRRYTWAYVFEDPGAMLRELRALLIAGEAAA